VANEKRENTQAAIKHGLRLYLSLKMYIRAQITFIEAKKS
jgi:hypothetical protein